MSCAYLMGILFVLHMDRALGQGSGTTATGAYYVCVPTGYCDKNGDGSGGGGQGIDPRIVSPVSPTTTLPPATGCAAGMVRCLVQGPGSNCGVRYVSPVNTATEFASVGAYPWQVYIRNSTNQFAGSGVLVDNYNVVTAAHKVQNYVNNPSNLTLLFGVTDLTNLTNVQTRTVSKIVLHPSFHPCVAGTICTLKNDIAVLTLTTPVGLSVNTVNTACLSAPNTSYVGQSCLVSGWGQTSFGTNDAPTPRLRQVSVKVVGNDVCIASFRNSTLLGNNVDLYFDSVGELCAGGESMKDACLQDGGSPLVCPGTDGKFYVAGLVIWGKKCGLPGVYGVYVSMPNYRVWVDATTFP